MRALQYYRDLKRANTLLICDRLVESEVNVAKVLEKTSEIEAARKKLADAAKAGKIIERTINQRHHIMQPHHAWNRLIQLSGNEEKDFQALVKILEGDGIFSEKYIEEERVRNFTLIKVYKKRINGEFVNLEFVKDNSSGAFLLNNGWVETK